MLRGGRGGGISLADMYERWELNTADSSLSILSTIISMFCFKPTIMSISVAINTSFLSSFDPGAECANSMNNKCNVHI